MGFVELLSAPWFWLALGFMLLLLELMAPGTILLWFGGRCDFDRRGRLAHAGRVPHDEPAELWRSSRWWAFCLGATSGSVI